MSVFETLVDKPTAAYTWEKYNSITHKAGWQLIACENLSSLALADVMCCTTKNSRVKPSVYVEAGVAERVITAPLIQHVPAIKEQKQAAKKSIFERFKASTNLKIVESPQAVQLTMGKLTSTADVTPAFVVGYHTLTSGTSLGNAYKTGDGRSGAALTIAAAMDEASATELTAEFLTNPPLIRQYAEYVLRKCLGVGEDVVPMPNYSILDEQNFRVQFAPKADATPTEGQIIPVS